MDRDIFESLLERGSAIVAATRELCAKAHAERQRAAAIQREAQHALPVTGDCAQVGRWGSPQRKAALPERATLDAFIAERADPYRSAKWLIDLHGRWARHVALECAIARVVAGDQKGERLWRGVFEAVLELQKRPAPASSARSGAG